MSNWYRKLKEQIQYVYFAKVSKGPYQFLLKKIYKATDFDFLEKVWQLDYFREVLEPMELNLKPLKKVLVLAPHQDDEVIGCGGLLSLLSKQNTEITIGFLTNGASQVNTEESVSIRQNESHSVGKKLNASIVNVGFDNVSCEINKDNQQQLQDLLNDSWDAVFSIWPLDNPPKHRLCAYWLGKTLSHLTINYPIYLYAVHTDLLPNFYVDITSEIDAKQTLIAIYQSQLEAQNYAHLSLGMDAWRSRFLKVSPSKRYIETFMKIPASGYLDFRVLFEKHNPQVIFKGHSACIQSFKKLKNKL